MKALAAALALLALWLAGLGAAPLLDVDEGAFATASREMVASGDWGHTTLNGEDRFDKPILVYWLQATSLLVFGDSAFAVRLPSALCAFGLCLLIAGFVAPRLGRETALLAAGLWATMLGPLLIGRAATADALLNLLIAAAAFDLWRFAERDGADPAPLRRAALWIALGLLTKGPVALLVPGAAAALWLLLSPARPRLVLARRALSDLPAWAVLAGVALPWYAYALARHGPAFVQGFFVRHNLERFNGALEGHGGGALYHLVSLPLLMLPWTPLLLPLLRRWRALWGEPLARFLLVWAAFVVAFFSLAGTKLPHYGLYGLVPLTVLAAEQLRQASRALVGALGACAALLLGAAALGPALLRRFADGVAAHWLARLDAAAAPQHASAFTACVLLLVVALWMAWRHAPTRPRALLASAAVTTLALTTLALPRWAEALQGPVLHLAQEARTRGLPLVQWRLHQPSVGFYTGAEVRRRAPRPGELALMRREHFGQLSPREAASLELLREEDGFVLLRRRSAVGAS